MLEVGSLHYLKMPLDMYDWVQGKKVLEFISTIREKPVAIMQDNNDGTYEVAVRRFNHIYHSTVTRLDFRD